MARDGVANVVHKLRHAGLIRVQLGPDSWESRCPAHRGQEYAVAISLNEQDLVVLNCRSKRCPASAILRALDLSAVRLYSNTPNWVLRKLAERPIVPPIYVESPALPAEAQPRVLKSPPTPSGAGSMSSQTAPTASHTSSPRVAESPLVSAERLRSMIEQLHSARAPDAPVQSMDLLPGKQPELAGLAQFREGESRVNSAQRSPSEPRRKPARAEARPPGITKGRSGQPDEESPGAASTKPQSRKEPRAIDALSANRRERPRLPRPGRPVVCAGGR